MNHPGVIEVWAPDAGRVELVVGDHRHPMVAGADGRWVAPTVLRPGDDYRVAVDDGPARPDPRSRWQPEGVTGPSRVDDPTAFGWTDDAWRGFHLPSAVIYELHVGTFTAEGTFDAAARRLDHLVELGVTAVELMPVAEFPGRWGWGYDGVDLFAPHHSYGGPAGMRRFVDACHGAGIGVMVDVVYNHLGPSGNHLGEFGPYFTDRYHTPWGDALNFDGPGSDEVRRFVLDNALHWLGEHHVDGLRLDATHAIFDESPLHLLEELAGEVERLSRSQGRPLWLIAEDGRNDPRLLWSRDAGGRGLHATWNDDVHHALHVALTGERDGYYADYTGLADLGRALERGYVYDGRHSPVRGHRQGRPPHGIGLDRFVAFLQNHDQVGNRARGERISHLVGTARQRVGAALLLTSPFVPLLFQGEEWAASTPFPYFCDHHDPELAAAVRDGRRREFAAFGWDPADIPDPCDPATAESARLDWDERTREPHAGVLSWYRELIALRRAVPELCDPRREENDVHADEAGRLLVQRGRVAVIANLGAEPATIPTGGREEILAASGGVDEPSGDGIRLDRDSVVVLRG